MIQENIKPEDFFNVSYFKDFYNRKLRHKKGGGIDGLTPQKFWLRYESELEDIAKKCLDGNYKFSYYKEKLVLKERDKFPRIIAVPTMRDRMVLGVLNEYLQALLPDMVCHDVPNQYLASLNAFLAELNGDVSCFKTDFENFYDSLNHLVLEMKLSMLVDCEMLHLIRSAITTPILASKPTAPNSVESSKKGVPQGLAISNILASIYMSEFDEYFKNKQNSSFFYRRYVDDILVVGNFKVADYEKFFMEKISEYDLRMTLSKDKTECCRVGESDVDIDYIGYIIKNKYLISIRPKNVQTFMRETIRLITLLKNQSKDMAMRPAFIKENTTFYSYYQEVLNEQIAGFKLDGHLYGWLAYFQSMNDMQLLYSLDYIIHKKLLCHEDIPKSFENGILHLPMVYWNIKKKSGSVLTNFDDIKTDSARRVFLKKRGWIDRKDIYSEDKILYMFNAYKEYLKKIALSSIGSKY